MLQKQPSITRRLSWSNNGISPASSVASTSSKYKYVMGVGLCLIAVMVTMASVSQTTREAELIAERFLLTKLEGEHSILHKSSDSSEGGSGVTVVPPLVASDQNRLHRPSATIARHLSEESEAVHVSGMAKDFWQRVYHRAVFPKQCRLGDKDYHKVKTLDDQGIAAGPILQDCKVNRYTGRPECNPKTALSSLSSIRDLKEGRGFQFFLPPVTGHTALVLDRLRSSSSTGVSFVGDDLLLVASFGNKMIHLYEYSMEDMTAKKLDTVHTSGNPDLMDYDPERQLVVASQLFSGAQELYRLDLQKRKLKKHKLILAFKEQNRQKCHEATFYRTANANTTATVIAASSSLSSRQYTGFPMMIRLVDYQNHQLVAQFEMPSTEATKGFKVQGMRFIDDRHILADCTTYMVEKDPMLDKSTLIHKWHGDIRCPKIHTRIQQKEVQGRIVLLKLNFSVEDIVAGKRPAAQSNEFEVVQWLGTGISAVDGMAYSQGTALVADQVNDRVLQYKVDLSAENPISVLPTKTGYIMPHGVALSKELGRMAVTCYGDNSVFVQEYHE